MIIDPLNDTLFNNINGIEDAIKYIKEIIPELVKLSPSSIILKLHQVQNSITLNISKTMIQTLKINRHLMQTNDFLRHSLAIIIQDIVLPNLKIKPKLTKCKAPSTNPPTGKIHYPDNIKKQLPKLKDQIYGITGYKYYIDRDQTNPYIASKQKASKQKSKLAPGLKDDYIEVDILQIVAGLDLATKTLVMKILRESKTAIGNIGNTNKDQFDSNYVFNIHGPLYSHVHTLIVTIMFNIIISYFNPNLAISLNQQNQILIKKFNNRFLYDLEDNKITINNKYIYDIATHNRNKNNKITEQQLKNHQLTIDDIDLQYLINSDITTDFITSLRRKQINNAVDKMGLSHSLTFCRSVLPLVPPYTINLPKIKFDHITLILPDTPNVTWYLKFAYAREKQERTTIILKSTVTEIVSQRRVKNKQTRKYEMVPDVKYHTYLKVIFDNRNKFKQIIIENQNYSNNINNNNQFSGLNNLLPPDPSIPPIINTRMLPPSNFPINFQNNLVPPDFTNYNLPHGLPPLPLPKVNPKHSTPIIEPIKPIPLPRNNSPLPRNISENQYVLDLFKILSDKDLEALIRFNKSNPLTSEGKRTYPNQMKVYDEINKRIQPKYFLHSQPHEILSPNTRKRFKSITQTFVINRDENDRTLPIFDITSNNQKPIKNKSIKNKRTNKTNQRRKKTNKTKRRKKSVTSRSNRISNRYNLRSHTKSKSITIDKTQNSESDSNNDSDTSNSNDPPPKPSLYQKTNRHNKTRTGHFTSKLKLNNFDDRFNIDKNKDTKNKNKNIKLNKNVKLNKINKNKNKIDNNISKTKINDLKITNLNKNNNNTNNTISTQQIISQQAELIRLPKKSLPKLIKENSLPNISKELTNKEIVYKKSITSPRTKPRNINSIKVNKDQSIDIQLKQLTDNNDDYFSNNSSYNSTKRIKMKNKSTKEYLNVKDTIKKDDSTVTHKPLRKPKKSKNKNKSRKRSYSQYKTNQIPVESSLENDIVMKKSDDDDDDEEDKP